MPEAGEYLLTNAGFSGQKQPFISLLRDGQFTRFTPLDQTLTLRFDTRERFCAGWYDMTSRQDFACPDLQTIDKKYEQCPACQKRTGFNPAFYHAASVSKQQEERNLQPHLVYLAHFGNGLVKVGISHEAREISRLLEQGARTALILDTFPSAHIARQYEAQIAALPGIVETVQLRKKIELLTRPYDTTAGAEELRATRTRIEQTLSKKFSNNDPIHLDGMYFPAGTPDLSESFDSSSQAIISGQVTGSLGTLLFCMQQNIPVFLPLKKYVGYTLSLSYDETSIKLPARQISFF